VTSSLILAILPSIKRSMISSAQPFCAFILVRCGPRTVAHLHLMRLGSDLRESFWGFLQLGVSELDFDYHEYAHYHLNRFLGNVATPEFTRWLREVKH